MYLMIGNFKMFAVLTTTSAMISEPLSPVQKDIILNSQYQYINLIDLYFQNNTIAINFEFTITLEIEVKLITDTTTTSIDNNISITASSTSLNNIIFNITTDILQIEKTNETVAII